MVRWGMARTLYGNLMIGLVPDGAVCRISFVKGRAAGGLLKKWKRAWPQTKFVRDNASIADKARGIFSGRKAVAVVLTGTSFQQRVWEELIKIPAGATVSYGVLARRLKKPQAARAVGNALGLNPVPILVPCHRVLASQGRLGGYSGGLENKKRLLNLENTAIS